MPATNPANTELLALIEKSFHSHRENSIVQGKIIEIRKQMVIVDIGAKSEGVVPVSEFEDEEFAVGDEIEVLLERLENDEGMVVLSKEKAAHKQNWDKIVAVYESGGLVKGKVKSVVKGGLMVNVGVEAFLPGSQIDIIPPKDLNEYVGNIYEFKIVKVNDVRKNIVLSRREVIEAERAEQRADFLSSVGIGNRVEGIVKNITDFGAFIDLQGMDGLLHITDMSWGRINHPSEMLMIGQKIDVVILEVDKDKERVSLGLKQLLDNPWEAIELKYPINSEVTGKVTKLVPYGAFVELEKGVEGLIHVSELSWTRKINHPSELLKKGEEVEAVVIDIDKTNQRISLGCKQLENDPWSNIDSMFKVGDLVKGTVAKIASFGAFIQLEDDIDGLVHISQLSEEHVAKVKDILKVGDAVEARVIKVDRNERRIGLSIKAAEYSDEQLRKETVAFEALRPSSDLVGLEQAFNLAEEWSPSGNSEDKD